MRKKKIWDILVTCCLIVALLIGNLATIPMQAKAQETVGITYYMDSENGDDSNDGLSPKTAWKSLERIDQKNFQPGDKILFRQGTEYYGRFHPLGSGTKENPITIDIYDGDVIGQEAGERAALHGEGKYTHVIFLENMSNWNINNIEVSNKGTSNNERRVGINVEITKPGVYGGIHLDNLYVHDVTGTLDGKDYRNGGIYFSVNTNKNTIEGKETHFEDITIENCYVKDVSRTGISVGWTAKGVDAYGHGGRIPQDFLDKYYHTNVVIRNNYVERAGGDAIVPMFCIKPLIEYNVSDHSSQNTKDNPNAMYSAGIWPWRCEDAVFQYNEAFGTVLNGDGQAFDCDFSRGTTYQYNYSHDNEGGFMLVCQDESLESVIRYNVSQNDKRSLFMLSNPNEAVFYNNTFYIDGADIDSKHGGKASMYNNIFYNVGEKKTVSWGGNSKYDNNLYYGFENIPNDKNKIIGDPMFVEPGIGGTGTYGDSAIDTLQGYKLKADSKAINSGKVISENGGKDYEGNVLDALPDLGAFEFKPSNIDELNIYLGKYSDLKKEDYTEETYQVLEKSIENVKKIIEESSEDKEKIQDAYVELIAAAAGLKPKEEGDAPNLKVGIVSDAQSLLTDSRGFDNYRKALEQLKEKGIELLLDAGDVAENGSADVWREYRKIFLDVFPDENTRPEYLMVMGNHDYHGEGTPQEHRDAFNEIFEKEATNEHKIVNGYHFINITSYDSGSNYTEEDLNWLDEEIQKAIADAPELPVFVLGHPHAANTVYGSTTGWGKEILNKVFDKYEQVVYFSGHSHYPLDDERSIYQNKYTAIGTSSMNYLEMEPGKDQGIHPDGVYDNAQMMYMELFDDKADIERIDLINERTIKDNWVLNIPLNKEKFTYTQERAEKREAPQFPENAAITVSEIGSSSCKITFTQAKHEDFTHSYRIRAVDKKTGEEAVNFTIFSDFYNGISDMQKELSYYVTGLKPMTEYETFVSGIESFGKEGEAIKAEVQTIDPVILDMDFSDGTFLDSSKYHTKSVLNGEVPIVYDEELKKNVAQFNGDSYVNLKMSEEQLNTTLGNFNYEVVFKLNELGKVQDVFGNGESAGVCLEVTPNGNAQFWAWSKEKGGYVRTDTQIEAGKYYHYVVTYDGEEMSVFLDGKKADTKEMSGQITHPKNVDMSLGVDPTVNGGNQGCFLDGNIALIKMENRSLSDVQAQEKYVDYVAKQTGQDKNVLFEADLSDYDLSDSSMYQTPVEKKGNFTVEYDEVLQRDAMKLDGESYAFLNVSEYQNSQMRDKFTLETVFKLDKLGKTQDIISNTEYGGMGLEVTPDGNAQLWVWSNELNDYVRTDTQVEAGIYYHYQATYDGNHITIYVNGEEVDRKEMNGTIKHPSAEEIPFCIGGDPQSGRQARYLMEGIVGAVKFEHEAIDAQTAEERYKAYKEDLVGSVDKSNLEALVQYAQQQKEEEAYEYVLPVVKQLLEEALKEAETVLENEKATQNEVDHAYEELLSKVHLLGFVGNPQNLKILVDVVSKMDLSIYTKESADVVKEALENAKLLLEKENVLQEELDEAQKALQDAVDHLIKQTVDKSKLEKLVKDAEEKYVPRLEEYLPDGRAVFEDALKNAKEVLMNEEATKEEVEHAYTTLQYAIFELREIPSKDKLEELIQKAESLDTSKYTEQSVKRMKNILEEVKLTYADKNATKEEVKKAEEKLETAIGDLEVKKAVAKVEKKDNKNSNKAAKTGDFSPVVSNMSLLLIAFGAMLVIHNKKSRRK